jgi:hypothetical protein
MSLALSAAYMCIAGAPAQSPHASTSFGVPANHARICCPSPISLTQGYGAGAQAGGGIAISGLPAKIARFNGTYAPTGALIQGYPSFSAGPKKHLRHHSGRDKWHLSSRPFDPASTNCVASIPAAAGPVPTGARAWRVHNGRKWVDGEVTAREVDAAAAAEEEAERATAEAVGAAVAAAQGKRVVCPPTPPSPLSVTCTVSSACTILCRPCLLLGPAPSPPALSPDSPGRAPSQPPILTQPPPICLTRAMARGPRPAAAS